MIKMTVKHIVIDARIRRASTGRPIDRLLEYLQIIDNDNKYTILLEPGDEWKPISKKFTTVICRYMQFSLNPLQQITFARQLYKLKPDLVHFTMTSQQPIFYFGRQITFTHDLTMLKYARAGRLPKWLHAVRMLGYRFLLWQSHRKALKIVVPTEYVRNAVAKYHLFTNRKLVVTYEASEPPLLGVEQKPNYAPDEYLLYVGSAFPHKNLDRLIEAFELLKEHHPALKLLLVGKQEYHSRQLQKWAKKRASFEDIIFTGFVPDEDLKWLYIHAEAYVFPSLSEGFGLPPLEAMVHGCPVVSSNATSLPEVCGDAAHYFNPEDIHEMAEKINDVMVNTALRNKLVSRGYDQVKKFSWKRMAEDTLKIYNSLFQ